MNSKRNREEACSICNHYHDYEGGEPCSVCGHVKGPPGAPAEVVVQAQEPTLILNEFLYLGGYDAASRCELLKFFGVSHILNCVPKLEVLYRTSFTYHTVTACPAPLHECFAFLDECHRRKQRVLVYCMTGTSRSPTVVIAYLMKLKGWRLSESYRWVKDRRPKVKLSDSDFARLSEAETEIFGSPSVPYLEQLEACVSNSSSFQFFHSTPLPPFASRQAPLTSDGVPGFGNPVGNSAGFCFGDTREGFGGGADGGDVFVFGSKGRAEPSPDMES
ncbi:hypothetical protein BSKO_00338 [Bryopsis sp. KO-2023]|nr:hypothetical protein BSKO_00338 [Bryopsis sp. KO-2023]